MNKKITMALIAAMAVGVVAVSGCSSTSASKEKDPDVWGYVASADDARFELAEDQDGVEELVVDEVVVPGDAWIVVHADDNGKPGMRVGLQHIDKGESTDVKVKLEDLTTPNVIVAIHADRGEADEFDFDMMNKEMSPDRPYFVDRKELAKVVKVREFGIPTAAETVALEVTDQPGSTTEIVVDRVLAPEAAWVVVHLEEDGGPGARVGLVHIPAGESSAIKVTLDPVELSDRLLVAVHADRGTPDVFDFNMMDKINSIDQPYFVGEAEVAAPVAIK